MPDYILLLLVLALMGLGYNFGRKRAVTVSGKHISTLHSLPNYYGGFVAVWCGVPALILIVAWTALQPVVVREATLAAIPDAYLSQDHNPERLLALTYTKIRNIAAADPGSLSIDEPQLRPALERFHAVTKTGDVIQSLAVLALIIAGGLLAFRRIEPAFRARPSVEKFLRWVLFAASTVAILVTIGIVLSLLFEALRFFTMVSPFEFFLSWHWSPQTAIRADQVGSSGSFGAIPVFTGTLLVTFVAVVFAGPIGLLSAVYLAEYASPKMRSWGKPALEVLAGIPTVVYGFFAATSVAPMISDFGRSLGLDVDANTALAAGGVMGIMLIPFISSLSDDVINAVPQTLRDGSYAVGATKSETIIKVILPAALPGIIGSFLLAVSRAIGETMIVVMAAGLAANLTINPLQSVTTVTVQIVALLTGDQEFDSAKTLSAFALGLTLFAMTLCLNLVALRIVNTYREKYD